MHSDDDADLLYFDRYWLEEQQVCDDVLTLLASSLPGEGPSLRRLFPDGWEEQRAAAEVAMTQSLTVLTGGPGTGKTTTVARLTRAVGANPFPARPSPPSSIRSVCTRF